jgi:probable rRNA maturation factor
MIEVEVFGVRTSYPDGPPSAPRGAAQHGRGDGGLPSLQEMRRLCALAAGSAGISDGHVAIEFVDERRITELNARYRTLQEPTDVLSFPVDGAEPLQIGRELGDVVICPQHTADVREAIVHGVLHLVGMDHETDDGQMLALQRQLLERQDG